VLAWLGVVAALWSGDAGGVGSPVVPLSPLGDAPTDEFKPRVEQPYLYTALETAALIGGGTVWYLRHGFTNENWGSAFTWRTWKGKLTGENVYFDGDHFNTNAAGHPLDGWAFYQIARGNGLGPGGAFISAALASTFWEYFVELPEHPSINDMILTPVGGAVIGEATYRLGRYLAVSGSSSVQCAAAFILAPVATFNDGLRCHRRDGILPSAHLELNVGLNRAVFTGGVVRDEFALGFASEVVTQRAYQRAGLGSVVVGPGQWTAFNGDIRLDQNRATGAWFHARSVWTGRYWRNYHSMTGETDLFGTGGPAHGWGWLIGLGSAFDYRLRDLPTLHDRIASVGLAGPSFELSARNGARVRAYFDLQYAFALVGSMAYRTDYLSLVDSRYKGELSNFGYYYAHGLVSSANLFIDLGPIGFLADGRGGWYWSINGGDPGQSDITRDVLLHDTRFYLTTAMWTRPLVGLARFGIAYQQVWRHSNMLGTTIGSQESDILGTAGVYF